MRLQVARAKLRKIVERAGMDSSYLQAVEAKPVDVLREEGLPYDVIEDFLREMGQMGEVLGYADISCANSCALTGINLYPKAFHHSSEETA